MNRLTVAPAQPEDALRLGPSLRQADRDEVLAASGMDPTQALRLGLAISADAYTILAGGVPIACFGVVDRGGGEGAPWLLGSDAILTHWREFARRSHDELERVRRPWRTLENYVDTRNTLHLRWLEWLGATFYGVEPEYGVARLPFRKFQL